MSEITANSIKELREMTGAGMMDCKKALTENNGNVQEAVDWLRKKGLSTAAKKSSRVAAEGVVAVKSNGLTGAMIELNSETDFVARNEKFQTLAKTLVDLAMKEGANVETFKAAKEPASGLPVAELISQNVGTIGENMNLRRSAQLTVKQGVVATYIHSAVAPGLGKIGVLVALESEGDKAELEQLGKQIAMHIAAAKPEALHIADVKAENLERERSVLIDQAVAAGKTKEIAEKMVEGRIRKYYEEVVLHEQIYVLDNKTKIAHVVEEVGKKIGKPVKLAAFAHFKLGEGIEKEATDFAAEVKAAAGAA
jgi:elongation factor Ts